MAGHDADLLAAALKALGLAARRDRFGPDICDSSGRSYLCFRDGDPEGASPPPADLRGFLKVNYFEHCDVEDYNAIYNTFCGMSPEEVELRLAVMGE